MGDGVVVSYYEFVSQDHVVIVCAADGQILREFTVDLWNAEYLFIADQTINLVAYLSTGFPYGETYTVHTYSPEGTPLAVDTALVVPLPDGFTPAGHAYHFADGVLTVASALVESGSAPRTYDVYLGRHSASGRSAGPVWHPGPIPQWSFIQGWTLTRAPDGSDVLGFFVAADLEPEIRIAAFDAQGFPLPAVERSYAVADLFSLSGMDVAVAGETVYPLYAAQARSSEETSGLFIAAFPFADFLNSPQRPPLPPRQVSLTAYPNPFNAAVRIDFTAFGQLPATLQIFDLTGRRVADLPVATGSQSLIWKADGLPSGVYYLQLQTPQTGVAQRLLLLR